MGRLQAGWARAYAHNGGGHCGGGRRRGAVARVGERVQGGGTAAAGGRDFGHHVVVPTAAVGGHRHVEGHGGDVVQLDLLVAFPWGGTVVRLKNKNKNKLFFVLKIRSSKLLN